MISFTGPGEPVRITSDGSSFAGVLELPPSPWGMVLYAQGRGRRSVLRESGYLADQFRRAGLATLQFDFSNPDEDGRARHGFDLALLDARMGAASDWIAAQPQTNKLALGLFGAGKEAAAALRLAADRPDRVAAVVSRSGRPDLAGEDALARVRAATLLIVDEEDRAAIERNRKALHRLNCEKDLALIPGAGYPSKRLGAALEAARLAARWFKGYFGGDTRSAPPGAEPSA